YTKRLGFTSDDNLCLLREVVGQRTEEMYTEKDTLLQEISDLCAEFPMPTKKNYSQKKTNF
ncbi:uncharacterized protein, partial [Leptinotarsa decemlineata]|uniref:uncharacterized protein n=1 Tax=Leptinotarsa decemlineata TaxID=7539 RepID=UPI003D309DB3